MPTEQVKYFTDSGETILPLDPPVEEALPVQAAMYTDGNPWPAVVFVLCSFALIVLCCLGSVWILHT